MYFIKCVSRLLFSNKRVVILNCLCSKFARFQALCLSAAQKNVDRKKKGEKRGQGKRKNACGQTYQQKVVAV